MKQIRLERPYELRIHEATPVTPGPNEALVRFRLGGICGSDLAAYRGVSPLVTYPRVLGHELVVDIIDAPDRPTWNGQRAVIEPLVSCGNCPACLKGRYNCCVNLKVLGVHIDGGFQETFVVPLHRLHVIPRALRDDVAVLVEPLSIAYRAVERSRIDAGKRAVVFGAGTIGLLIAHVLIKARGCRVFIVDVDPARLKRAAAIGAVPLESDADTVVSAIADMTRGELADVVFEATGHPACSRLATELVAFAGTIVLIGWNHEPVAIDTVTLMRKEANLIGSRNSNNAFPAVLRLLSDGVVDAKALITHDFPLDETERALKMLDEGRGEALKIILRPPSLL